MRRNPSTVVVLAGQAPDAMLAAVGRSMNVVLVHPEESGPGSGSSTGPGDVLEVATGALRRAAGISSPYVLVAADPLAALAAEWRAMWEIPREVSREPRGAGAFELRAAEALAAWRAGRFELPDYYLVLAADTGPATPEEPRPGFYPGPLRSVRPHRVAVVAAAEPAKQAAGVLSALGSLQRRAMMASAPGMVQCMPDCLSLWPMTDLQPASTTPEPTNMPRDRKWA